jgi:hypothetical protein
MGLSVEDFNAGRGGKAPVALRLPGLRVICAVLL